MKIFVIFFCTVFGFGGTFRDFGKNCSKPDATVKRFLEENMGYGSIINKLNSFMENIEDPEQTKQNLQDFNLGLVAMPANQLEGENLKFKQISVNITLKS